jgi:hypothetical protein
LWKPNADLISLGPWETPDSWKKCVGKNASARMRQPELRDFLAQHEPDGKTWRAWKV